MSELVYEPIPFLEQNEIIGSIERNDPDELSIAVLSAALYQEPEFSEPICITLADHLNFKVRGNAILGFAHIARLYYQLHEPSVKPLIEKALKDSCEYVSGQAESAKDDLELYLGWKL